MPFESLHALYARQLAERGFSADEAQVAAVERLDRMRTRLIAAHQADSGPWQRLLRIASKRRAHAPVRGLYLWGGVGRGKTWLMDLFFQSLPFQQRRRRHFHRFMQDVHSELKRLHGQEAPLEIIGGRLATQARVLCLDELFVSDIADAMILGGLFAALLGHGVTLVATSNVVPADLYRDGLQRERFRPTIALLEQSLDVSELRGATDYRLRQLTTAGTYLLLGATDTTRRLTALFHELSGEPLPADAVAQSPGELEIEGRRMPVVLESSAAVWFDFAVLCGGPRSQYDYIEIARRYQSVILSDVPVLDAQRDDEARRFVALVDELYDHRVNLIVSAAAPPAALYRGERIAALFERTASRLVQMQSREYLASEHRP